MLGRLLIFTLLLNKSIGELEFECQVIQEDLEIHQTFSDHLLNRMIYKERSYGSRKKNTRSNMQVLDCRCDQEDYVDVDDRDLSSEFDDEAKLDNWKDSQVVIFRDCLELTFALEASDRQSFADKLGEGTTLIFQNIALLEFDTLDNSGVFYGIYILNCVLSRYTFEFQGAYDILFHNVSMSDSGDELDVEIRNDEDDENLVTVLNVRNSKLDRVKVVFSSQLEDRDTDCRIFNGEVGFLNNTFQEPLQSQSFVLAGLSKFVFVGIKINIFLFIYLFNSNYNICFR